MIKEPLTPYSSKIISEDGQETIEYYLYPKYYYNDQNKLEVINLKKIVDFQATIGNIKLLRESNTTIGLRKDNNNYKYLGLRPSKNNQLGESQIEFTIENININSTNIPIDLSQYHELDYNVVSLGNVLVQHVGKTSRQIIKSESQIDNFDIRFRMFLKNYNINNEFYNNVTIFRPTLVVNEVNSNEELLNQIENKININFYLENSDLHYNIFISCYDKNNGIGYHNFLLKMNELLEKYLPKNKSHFSSSYEEYFNIATKYSDSNFILENNTENQHYKIHLTLLKESFEDSNAVFELSQIVNEMKQYESYEEIIIDNNYIKPNIHNQFLIQSQNSIYESKIILPPILLNNHFGREDVKLLHTLLLISDNEYVYTKYPSWEFILNKHKYTHVRYIDTVLGSSGIQLDSDQYYTINSSDDFFNLGNTSNYNDWIDKNFKLGNDIDMIDYQHSLKPIGISSDKFKGCIFDGKNYSISNIGRLGVATQNYQGIFGYIMNSSIKNLEISGYIHILGDSNVGLLVGRYHITDLEYQICELTNIRISCHGSVEYSHGKSSFFVGNFRCDRIDADLTVTNCSVNFNGHSRPIPKVSYPDNVDINTTLGENRSPFDVGTFFGRMLIDDNIKGTITIKNCYSCLNGDLYYDGYDVGGFIGAVGHDEPRGKIRRNNNFNFDSIVIENCFNIINGDIIVLSRCHYCGGFIGGIRQQVLVNKCFNLVLGSIRITKLDLLSPLNFGGFTGEVLSLLNHRIKIYNSFSYINKLVINDVISGSNYPEIDSWFNYFKYHGFARINFESEGFLDVAGFDGSRTQESSFKLRNCYFILNDFTILGNNASGYNYNYNRFYSLLYIDRPSGTNETFHIDNLYDLSPTNISPDFYRVLYTNTNFNNSTINNVYTNLTNITTGSNYYNADNINLIDYDNSNYFDKIETSNGSNTINFPRLRTYEFTYQGTTNDKNSSVPVEVEQTSSIKLFSIIDLESNYEIKKGFEKHDFILNGTVSLFKASDIHEEVNFLDSNNVYITPLLSPDNLPQKINISVNRDLDTDINIIVDNYFIDYDNSELNINYNVKIKNIFTPSISNNIMYSKNFNNYFSNKQVSTLEFYNGENFNLSNLEIYNMNKDKLSLNIRNIDDDTNNDDNKIKLFDDDMTTYLTTQDIDINLGSNSLVNLGEINFTNIISADFDEFRMLDGKKIKIFNKKEINNNEIADLTISGVEFTSIIKPLICPEKVKYIRIEKNSNSDLYLNSIAVRVNNQTDYIDLQNKLSTNDSNISLENLIDNNLETSIKSTTTDAYIEVDLGNQYNLNDIKIVKHVTPKVKNIKISDTNININEIDRYDPDNEYIALSEMYFYDNNNQEIPLYDENSTQNNYFTYQMSSEWNHNGDYRQKSFIKDGNMLTAWHSSHGDVNPWVKFEFESYTDLNEIVVTNRANDLYIHRIENKKFTIYNGVVNDLPINNNTTPVENDTNIVSFVRLSGVLRTQSIQSFYLNNLIRHLRIERNNDNDLYFGEIFIRINNEDNYVNLASNFTKTTSPGIDIDRLWNLNIYSHATLSSNNGNQFIEIDFGSNVYINEIKIVGRQEYDGSNGSVTGTVYFSDDSNHFTNSTDASLALRLILKDSDNNVLITKKLQSNFHDDSALLYDPSCYIFYNSSYIFYNNNPSKISLLSHSQYNSDDNQDIVLASANLQSSSSHLNMYPDLQYIFYNPNDIEISDIRLINDLAVKKNSIQNIMIENFNNSISLNKIRLFDQSNNLISVDNPNVSSTETGSVGTIVSTTFSNSNFTTKDTEYEFVKISCTNQNNEIGKIIINSVYDSNNSYDINNYKEYLSLQNAKLKIYGNNSDDSNNMIANISLVPLPVVEYIPIYMSSLVKYIRITNDSVLEFGNIKIKINNEDKFITIDQSMVTASTGSSGLVGNNPIDGNSTNSTDGSFDIGGGINNGFDNNYFTCYKSSTTENSFFEINLGDSTLINEIHLTNRFTSDGTNMVGNKIKLLSKSVNDFHNVDELINSQTLVYNSDSGTNSYDKPYGYVYYFLNTVDD